ncbi:MAG TPA: ATP-binding protein, partial [Verrucomicrobiae bacterium]|nr:ATP-binding protein [Verrucomicrobiae bacterium]
EASGESSASDNSKVNILLVDDRADKLLALEAVLSSLGQNLVKARSGKEALKVLLKREFAVILLDVSMPVMDGFETASMIRQRSTSEHTPIIFVTSHNDSENHIARGYSLGAVDYILSPIVPGVLKSKVSVFVDLYKQTEQIKQQAEQLRRMEEEQHQRRLSEAVDRLEAETKRNRFFTLALDMLAIANFEGYILQCNPAWEKVLGYLEAELRSRPGLDFAHPADQPAFAAELRKLREGLATSYFEGRCRHKDGSYRWLGWTAVPFPAERLIYIFARDITSQKQADEEIRRLNEQLHRRVAELTEVNVELEAFNYSISHDLRAPIRSMQGFARAVLEDEGSTLGPDGKSYVERIVNSGGYMDMLLQDLLNYSRLTRAELNLGPVDLTAALQDVLTHNCREIQDRKAQIQVKPPLGWVMAHPATLNQIIANLIGNAVKFVATDRPPGVNVWADAEGEWVRLSVEDNGIGIAPAHQKKIFGLFERLHSNTAYPGTGIGLAIVRKGIERMGGRLGVESKAGEGSRFWIELPKAQPDDS